MGKKGAQALTKNPNWKGGRTIASNGYVLLKKPSHRLADTRGYVYEHRLVAEETLGRVLNSGEVVHHRDGNKTNNDPANLEVFSDIASHRRHHRKRQDLRPTDSPNPVISCSCGCAKTFLKYDKSNRPRRFISGHNMMRADRSRASRHK